MKLFKEKKPRSLLYLGRGGFDLFSTLGGESLRCSFSERAVSRLEVVDPTLLQSEIKAFLQEKKLVAGNLILMLLQDVTFEKKITATETSGEENEVKNFLDEVPFERVGKRLLRQDSEVLLVATNRDLYEGVKRSFEEVGWEVSAVVPLSLFGKDKKADTLSQDEVARVLTTPSLMRSGNFLLEETEVQTHKKSSYRFQNAHLARIQNIIHGKLRLVVFGIVLAVLLGILLVLLMGRGKTESVKRSVISEKGSPVASPSVVSPTVVAQEPESTSSAQIPETNASFERSKLKIKVVNATGVVGQAKKVADELKNLGYTLIETANSRKSDLIETEVIFAPHIPLFVQDEMVGVLKESFVKVIVKQEAIEKGEDIVITTGRTREKEGS